MNWMLFLAVLFTFMFVVYVMREILRYLYALVTRGGLRASFSQYLPFISALLASIFWALV